MPDLTSSFDITVRNEVRWARVASAVVVGCSLLFALYLSQVVFLLGAIGWAAFAAAIFGPLALGLFWKRATGLATTVAITFSMVANLGGSAFARLVRPVHKDVCRPRARASGRRIARPRPEQGREADPMTIDRVDRLVALCFVITTVATVGMIFDYWQLVYYAIPLLTTVLIVMGCLDRHAAWLPAALMWTVAFGAILLALFTVADITRAGGALLGGLPASTGVFLYLIWPFSTVAAPLLFAWVYHRWLRYDLDADSGERAS